MKQKKPQIGDLVRLTEQPWPDQQGSTRDYIGIVLEHEGIRSLVCYTSGVKGWPMRDILEVL